MVFYTKAFHKPTRFGNEEQEEESSMTLDVEDSNAELTQDDSSESSTSMSESGDEDLEFGRAKKRSSDSSSSSSAGAKWTKWMCAAKLGVLAALMTVIVAYLSFKWFKMEWFVKMDPVRKTHHIHWNKISGTALTVFAAVTLIAYVMNA